MVVRWVASTAAVLLCLSGCADDGDGAARVAEDAGRMVDPDASSDRDGAVRVAEDAARMVERDASSEGDGAPPIAEDAGPMADRDSPRDGGDSDGGVACDDIPLQGYGTLSAFGGGGEQCVVTNLDDEGPGSLRDCVENRDGDPDAPTPRLVTFARGGTIVRLSDLSVRQPYLTIDGFSAPAPGITLEKQGGGEQGGLAINTWPGRQTCGHDVLVQGIRSRGVWTEDTEDHSQNAGTLGLDGEDLPLCLRNVVIHRVTVVNAQDSGGDIWGSASDITVSYSAFLNSLHPNTYSHAPGGEPDQQRERISNHHNLYAFIHERGPQVRGDIRDSNFEQNIMHKWAAYGFGGGYATRFRCRDGACPSRINLIANHWTSGGSALGRALILGEASGPGDDDPIAAQVFSSGNRLPGENVDDGSAPA